MYAPYNTLSYQNRDLCPVASREEYMTLCILADELIWYPIELVRGCFSD